MPRPDPAVRDRIASQRAHRMIYARGIRLDVDVLRDLADPWLRGRPKKVGVIDQQVRTDTRRTP